MRKIMKQKIMLLLVVASLTGCASITGDTTQFVRVETFGENGVAVKGAKCTFQNDYGTVSGDSGGQIQARRSSKDLYVECNKEGYPAANARAISRANGGMFGNILFGGGIGAIIDHNKGTAYTYPEWLKLVFGKMFTFDRTDDKDGQPSLAKQENATTAVAKAEPAAAPAKE
jgi:hypothetical protein